MPSNFNRYCGNSSRARKFRRDSAIFPSTYKDAGRWFTRASTDDATGRGRFAGASADAGRRFTRTSTDDAAGRGRFAGASADAGRWFTRASTDDATGRGRLAGASADAGRWFTRTSTDDADGRGRFASASTDGWTFIFNCARVIRKLSSALSVNQLPDMALRNVRAVLVAYV